MNYDKAQEAAESMKRDLLAQGFRIQAIPLQPQEGCRACGDKKVGPWTATLLCWKNESKREAAILWVTLCRRCLGNEDARDRLAKSILGAYLRGADQK